MNEFGRSTAFKNIIIVYNWVNFERGLNKVFLKNSRPKEKVQYDCELLTELNESKASPSPKLLNATIAKPIPQPQTNITTDIEKDTKFYLIISNFPANVTDQDFKSLSNHIQEVHNQSDIVFMGFLTAQIRNQHLKRFKNSWMQNYKIRVYSSKHTTKSLNKLQEFFKSSPQAKSLKAIDVLGVNQVQTIISEINFNYSKYVTKEFKPRHDRPAIP